MGISAEAALRFAFRWYGLQDRRLTSWTDPARYVPRDYQALQNEVTTQVTVPADTPPSALGPYVQTATARLFAAFDGASIPSSVVEDLTRNILRVGRKTDEYRGMHGKLATRQMVSLEE
ncbi:MAG TPA: hypothetical protein VI055_15330 [Rubrobacter sp.]